MSCTLKAQTKTENGIHFTEAKTEEDMKVLGEKSIKENKPMFIDCYTSWCGPCKWMATDIFTNDTVAEYYNKNFICVKMDMEKGVGIARSFKYNVNSYPTFLFVKDGKVNHRASGTRPIKGFMELGKTAIDPEKRFDHWVKQYQAGNRDQVFIRDYIKTLNKAGLDTKEVADWYFTTQSKQDLLNKDNYEIIVLNVNSYTDSMFDFILQNKNKYESTVGKEKVDKMIYNIFQDASPFQYFETSPGMFEGKFNDTLYNEIVTKIKQVDFERRDEVLTTLSISNYYAKKDWVKYIEQITKYLNDYSKNDPISFNDYAWAIYENEAITDKATLELAITWVKKSIELANEYYNNDTYAALLYKMKNKEEAIKMATKAMELGKKAGENTTSTQKMLDKIKALK